MESLTSELPQNLANTKMTALITYIIKLLTPTPPQSIYKITILGYEGAGEESLLRGLTDKGAPKKPTAT